LGMLIDDKLSFDEHVATLVQKSYYKLKLLYANRHTLSTGLKKYLCELFIMSILNYGDVVYYPFLTGRSAQRLQKVQNSCCRFVTSTRKYAHVTPKYCELGWLKLAEAVKLHYVVFVHKLLSTSTPDYLRTKISF